MVEGVETHKSMGLPQADTGIQMLSFGVKLLSSAGGIHYAHLGTRCCLGSVVYLAWPLDNVPGKHGLPKGLMRCLSSLE